MTSSCVVVQVLSAARHDERVKGVVTLLGGRENFQGLAQMQELRSGVLDYRVGGCIWHDMAPFGHE